MEFKMVPNTESPRDGTPLVRYMSALKLVNLLRTRSVHMSTLSELRDSHDPWEGAPTEPRLRVQEAFATRIGRDRAERLAARLKDDVPHVRATTHVCCFNVHDDERMSLWERYAPDGIALVTRPEKLRAALEGDDPVALLLVNYSNFADDDMAAGPYAMASTNPELSVASW